MPDPAFAEEDSVEEGEIPELTLYHQVFTSCAHANVIT